MQYTKQHYPDREQHGVIYSTAQAYFHGEAAAGWQQQITALPAIPYGKEESALWSL